ncbi:MAG: preprotein translocase subunit SecY [Candidatus Dormibacteria bacterium]
MNLFQALAKAMQIPELRKKLAYTVVLLIGYRVLASISIPGANAKALDALFSGNSLLGLLNLFSGGGLSKFTIVGLGLNPYINATIIMQLMTVVSVRLKELSKEGEQGRKRITRYTRWLTVPLAALQGYGFMALFTNPSATAAGAIISNPTTAQTISIILTLTAGTVIAMWLGELITEYGVGNGVSLIIFVGIIGRLPESILTYYQADHSHVVQILIMAVVAVAVTAGIIEVQQAQRKIPVQSAQRVLNPRTGAAAQGRRNFLPLKVNAAGVIPIIFAISIMAFPTIFANLFGNVGDASSWVQRASDWIRNNWQPQGPAIPIDVLYNAVYFMLILGFTYFYTAVVFDPNDVADNLKKSSTFIPGIRPGRQTAEYLGRVMGRITLAGALFLAGITVLLPILTSFATGVSTSTLYLGGTSVLIVVGVGLDTMKQIESQLLMRQYRGFIK